MTDEGVGAEELDLSMLKYSRAISETSPIVVGLVRSEDDEAENILELQTLKMRNAPLPDRSIILRPNLKYMRIHEELVSKKRNFLDMKVETKKRKMKSKSEKRRR